MKKFKSLLAILVLLTAISCSKQAVQSENYTKWVDPYIGTGGHGHVFMGANVPFGAVQLGPTSIPQEWDWTSGYHISDTTVIGFAHTHLSGTGIGDLSDIVLMPVVGTVKHARGKQDDPQSGMWSYFSRKNERTRPGYYATKLDRYDIGVELTATERVGFHKYTFPATTDAAVIINLRDGTCWDSPADCYIERIDEKTIAGYRFSKGWAYDQRVFFVAEFSRPMSGFEVYEGDELRGTDSLTTKALYGKALFDATNDQEVLVKVAISPVSIENAKLNMKSELAGWDFDATVKSADDKWNAELGKIAIQGKDESAKRIFYTALYHSMIAPSLFCDVNGDYRGADGKYYKNANFKNYTTFSLWDTYRAAHPLMTLIHPEKMSDMINTMLSIAEQQGGKLPVWHLMGCETNCMVGNPGISVVADAVAKGIEGFDTERAFNLMKSSAMLDERGLNLLKEYGYIPYDKMNEAVANCMEYAIADGALAEAAKKLGKEEDYNYFLNRSHSYRKYYDKESRFMRGLSADGSHFRTPFNPIASTHREDDYCEGNAWQYTFLAPHDFDGLVGLFGGREQFITKLDSLFSISSELLADASPDITGLIGQYAHGNEPSHHILYFYTMAGEPYKAADKIREVLSTLYFDKPDGLSGNEDVGQMSSWYILSSLGFYQVEPAGGKYYFGSPIFDEVKIRVKGGEFVVKTNNNSAQNKYIQSVTLNGKPYNMAYISYADIVAGGELVFEMGTERKTWY